MTSQYTMSPNPSAVYARTIQLTQRRMRMRRAAEGVEASGVASAGRLGSYLLKGNGPGTPATHEALPPARLRGAC